MITVKMSLMLPAVMYYEVPRHISVFRHRYDHSELLWAGTGAGVSTVKPPPTQKDAPSLSPGRGKQHADCPFRCLFAIRRRVSLNEEGDRPYFA